MLAEPVPQFLYEYDDTSVGSPVSATVAAGTACTTGAANTKGSWVTVVAATDRDWYGFWLSSFSGASTAGTNSVTLLDVGIGAGGSEVVLLSNFLIGGQVVYAAGPTFGNNGPVFIPLFIPKGARVAVRAQSAAATRVKNIHIVANSGTSLPRAIYAGCDTFGASTAASTGVALSSNASANVFGSWTSIGGTTARDYSGFLMSHQQFASTTVSNRTFVLESGYNSTAFMRALGQTSTNETWTASIQAQFVGQFVPSGTQFQGRVSCTSASNTETPSVAIHAFY